LGGHVTLQLLCHATIGVRFFRLSFFFQAEDGIRDRTVTGVQTCALPIFIANEHSDSYPAQKGGLSRQTGVTNILDAGATGGDTRSEERRVGKEWRSRCEPEQ